MFLLKGLLIFSPPFLYKLQIFNSIETKIKLIALLFMLILTLSSFSFTGWLPDYLMYCFGGSMLLGIVPITWTRSLRVIVKSTTVVLFAGYVALNTLFGPRLIQAYEKNKLSFKLYEIPDMVAASTYRLNITEAWGIFESEIYDKAVEGIHCKTFDFDQLNSKLLIIDTCK